ncbi:hypothetical protein [Chryseobacterium sp. KCF3-3]|uniref:hypothetical protein n=1 Tax=Chryseobacterium sp. KCF3-3 TaxID=3231511 RepID=UPI0038B3B2B7
MSWNFFDIFDVVFDLFGLLGSGSKSLPSKSPSKPERKALNHNMISQKKDSKDPDSLPKK